MPRFNYLENNIRLINNNNNTIDRDNNSKDYNFGDNYYILPPFSHIKRLNSNNRKNSLSKNNIMNSNLKEN